MISNIDTIRGVDIRDVISPFVKLSRANKGKCPFHNEKSGSFSVNVENQIFKCFGCGISGDSFKFIMEHERLTFIEAAEKIAEIGKITVEYDERFREEETKKKEAKKPLYDTIQNTIGIYAQQLFLSDPGKAYAKQRGLTDEVISKWQIGFAPDDFHFLSSQIVGKGSPEHAVSIGLLRLSEKTGRHYDTVRNRLIFPICNEFGQVVSFSARIIAKTEKDEPKTVKGNNTDIMQWKDILFGLNHARAGIKKNGFAIIVEGEMDVISMHMAGADNTIGSGTKLMTPEQCRILKRYTDQVVLMPDNDETKDGKNPALDAAVKNMRLLLSNGFTVDIFLIPDGQKGEKQDPDDYAKQFTSKSKKNVNTNPVSVSTAIPGN